MNNKNRKYLKKVEKTDADVWCEIAKKMKSSSEEAVQKEKDVFESVFRELRGEEKKRRKIRSVSGKVKAFQVGDRDEMSSKGSEKVEEFFKKVLGKKQYLPWAQLKSVDEAAKPPDQPESLTFSVVGQEGSIQQKE